MEIDGTTTKKSSSSDLILSDTMKQISNSSTYPIFIIAHVASTLYFRNPTSGEQLILFAKKDAWKEKKGILKVCFIIHLGFVD